MLTADHHRTAGLRSGTGHGSRGETLGTGQLVPGPVDPNHPANVGALGLGMTLPADVSPKVMKHLNLLSIHYRGLT